MKAFLALLLATTALADEPTLTSLSEANRYALTLDHNSISGPGAEFLLRSSAGAQFVAIGEEHNVAEVAQFTAALFRLLHAREGFNYFADEQDPWMCHTVSRAPLRGNFDGIAALHRKYPNAFTFQGDQEMMMLADIGRLSTARSDPIWGLDQVFGALHILESLDPPNAAAREQTQKLIEIVRPFEEKRFVEGQRYMLEVGSLDDLVALKKLYGSHDGFLLDQLILSMRVYNNWRLAAKEKKPTGYESNREREENMKALFVRKYHEAERIDGQQPKVLLKFGHWHLFRGMSPGSVFTLGNFASELATSNGKQSFSIAVFLDDGPGSQRDTSKFAPWAKPWIDAATGPWTVIDLRPMRGYAHAGQLGTLDPNLRRFIFGFDAVLVGHGAHAATISSN
ncbi:MAG: hypothetical protein M3041_16505 [Acidobacteriota bacterium]|nr:hypothetical protein [Acidobacteriota bacterium]